MQKYNIDVQFIPGLPRNPYRHGISAYEGVVAHCTDSSNHSGGDTPTNERAWEVRDWQNAFVHFFVGVEGGKPIIKQTADINYKAWGAGPYANERFVHVELCMYDKPDMFAMAYDAYCYVLAKILHDKYLGVTPAKDDESGTLWTHADVSDYLGGTDHRDPVAYLQQHGKSVDQLVADVKAYYDWLSPSNNKSSTTSSNKQASAPKYVRMLKLQHPYLTGDDVRALQKRLNIPVDGIFGPQCDESLREWQSLHDQFGKPVPRGTGLVVDGRCGPITWKALFPSN